MSLRALLASTVALAACLGVAAAQTPARAPAGGSGMTYVDHFSPKVMQLLHDLTLDEKIALTWGAKEPVYGGQAGYSEGVPRLGIPSMRWADGQNGINSAYDGTSLPVSIALAATFDPEMARRSGEVLGSEARTMKIDVVLAPFVNLARFSNSSGAFGEDPYLAGRMAAEMVRGIQAQGAMTMAQQYVANVQGLHRGGGLNATEGYDFIVDDRALHEIYLPPFEASIRAGATSIMAAYNKVNGDYNSVNQRNLVGILRDELGFTGWANSDWHANRSTLSMTKGLDFEMPGAGPMDPEGAPPLWGPKLKAAVQAGQVPMADLDRAVGRRLTAMERFGIFDNTRRPAPAAIDVAKDAAIARAVATEAAVLVRNEGAILPLSQQAQSNLALIGPTVAQLPGAGGNRAYGFPDRLVPVLTALKTEAPGAKLTYAPGNLLNGEAIPASALTPAKGSGQGLTRDNGDGSPTVNEAVDYTTKTLPAGHAYVWRGTLKVPTSGAYTLDMVSWGGSSTLKVDGRVRGASAKLAFGHGVPRRWTSIVPTLDNMDHALATMNLEAGKSYTIEIEGIAEQNDPMHIRLGWITPQVKAAAFAQAVAAAKAADTAVVFVWNGRGGDQNEGELGSRLPNGQDEFVEAVAAANPNTVVVLNTGTGVDMPWAGKVKAILQMWTPGQEGAWATADLLLGKASPSGRLPMTWPKALKDGPAFAAGHPERYDGIADKQQVVFTEGVLVGYRWFDEQKIEPLYPFGYGLSYTTFAYSGLKTQAAGDGADVTFTVKNTGKLAGAEVAQVYLGPAKARVAIPPKSLSGFQRVSLQPGESKTVTVHLGGRQFAYWSTGDQRWLTPGGSRPVYVGASSRDVRLTGKVSVKASDGRVAPGERPGELAVKDMVTGRLASAQP